MEKTHQWDLQTTMEVAETIYWRVCRLCKLEVREGHDGVVRVPATACERATPGDTSGKP